MNNLSKTYSYFYHLSVPPCNHVLILVYVYGLVDYTASEIESQVWSLTCVLMPPK